MEPVLDNLENEMTLGTFYIRIYSKMVKTIFMNHRSNNALILTWRFRFSKV